MRVEVEIGTIEVDALPEGVNAERLMAAVAWSLEAEIVGFSRNGGEADGVTRSAFAALIGIALDRALGIEARS
jgi:hypothetical protein